MRPVLEVRRPVPPHEQPQHDASGERVGRLIEKPDGQESEDERAHVAPEPEVLMQHVEHEDQHDAERGRHGRYTTTSCVGLQRIGPAWRPMSQLNMPARRSTDGCEKWLTGTSTRSPAVPSGWML